MTYTGKRSSGVRAAQADPHEWQEQRAFFQWVDSHLSPVSGEQTRACSSEGRKVCTWELALVHSTPNEGERHVAVAGKLKSMGLRAGYPDVSLDAARGQHHGLRIEFKKRSEGQKESGGVRSNQTAWHDRLIRAGYCVMVAYDWEQAKNILVAYLLGEIDQYGICKGPVSIPDAQEPERPRNLRTDKENRAAPRKCGPTG